MMETSILSLLLFVLTFFSGYFSGSEAALFSLSSLQIKSYHSDQSPRKRVVAALLSQPRDLLVTIFMLNTVVNILLQNIASHLFGNAAGWGLKVGVPLILTLLFGEIIPKYIGLQNNVMFACHVAPTINFLKNILKPIRIATISITDPISRFMFFFLKKEKHISKEELQHVLKTSQEHGVLNADEAELVCGYLHLQEASVKEVMRPKEDILYYSIHEPLTKLIHLFADQKCSKLPVCDKSLDNVIGIITVKQFFLHRHQISSPSKLFAFLDKPFYIPESTTARLLLRHFDENQQVLALVVDEYGLISGLITYEDLVETVVGEIIDLRDQTSLYTRTGKNEIIASGKLELTEFNDLFNTSLVSQNNMITIGGWLTERLNEIPKTGTNYEFEGLLFHVLDANASRIRRLYIQKLKKNKS